jgi:site-specific DNA-cytosine methylase
MQPNIKLYFRGEPRPKVFPITSNSKPDIVLPTLTARYWGGQANGGYIGNKQTQVVAWSKSHRTGKTKADKRRKNYGQVEQRIKTNGEFNTISTGEGGGNMSTQNFIMRDGRDNRSCLRSGRTPEVGIKGLSIRRLTPTECERLQGFPDGWTEGISDTQRYKCLGNAVTTNVVQAVIDKLFQLEKGER